MNPITAGFFSLTSGAQSGDDDSYLRWHALDHQPEQYSIPGIRLATRWRADETDVAARAVAEGDFATTRHVVAYLMTDPLDATLRAFAELGRRTAETGRFPDRATPQLTAAYHLVSWYAAPRVHVSPQAIPFRPHRGIVLVIEDVVAGGDIDRWMRWHHTVGAPGALNVDGVAGLYTFRSSTLLGIGPTQGVRYQMPAWDPGDRIITVLYIDGDLHTTAGALTSVVAARWDRGDVRPALVGPFHAMTTHLAWPADTST